MVEGSGRWAAVAILVTALAAYTNPRSILALAIAAIAIVASAALLRDGPSVMTTTRRVATVAAAAILLSAPLLVPLVRYRDLYFFVHYERYESIDAYWSNMLTAVSAPVMALAFGGAVLALAARRYPIARAFAIALAGYAALTVVLSARSGLVEQLEPPRLMPFQRLLMVYFAAFGISIAVQRLIRFFRLGHPAAASAVVLTGVAVALPVLMW